MSKKAGEERNVIQFGWIFSSIVALAFVFLFLPSGAMMRTSDQEELAKEELSEITVESAALPETLPAQTVNYPPTVSPSSAPSIAPSPTATPFVEIIDDDRDITESLQVEINHGRKGTFEYHLAEVKVQDAKQLKAVFAQGEYGKSYREYTSKMARNNNAIVAINGDYYGFRNDGIIIRNGELYRDKASKKDLLLIDQNGDFQIVPESETSGEELLAQGIWQSFSFGPGLVENGQILEMPDKYMVSTRAREPRAAIGQMGPLHYLLVTVDGRRKDSTGTNLSDLAELMQELGCQTAYNLDGGGSATLVFRDELVNDVSGKGERSISDIIYFAKAD